MVIFAALAVGAAFAYWFVQQPVLPFQVERSNNMPSSEFSVVPRSGSAPLVVQLSKSERDPRDIGVDFGDGSVCAQVYENSEASCAWSSHTYRMPGTYTLKFFLLTGTNRENQPPLQTVTVTVQ